MFEREVDVPEYTFALCDNQGVGLSDVRAPVKLDFTRNQPPTAKPTLDIEEEASGLLVVTLQNMLPRLKVWLDGVLIFNGPWAPHQEDAQDFEQTLGTLAGEFRGPFWLLENRDTDATFTAQDAGQIAWSLIDASNTNDGATGIRLGTIATTVNRDQAYAGKQIAEAITDLAAMDGGFDFEVAPVDEGAICGVFNVTAHQGVDRSSGPNAVVFEFGPGTIGNVRSAHRETRAPVNVVLVRGANGLTGSDSDSDSIVRYGTFKRTEQASDVTDQTTLNAMATALLRPDPVRVITFVPDPELAPRPFEDFGLGDTVAFRARFGALVEDLTPRVNGIAPEIDEDGNVSALTIAIDQAV